MKKLLTLVLALVMVFAIAAPALAITGDTTSDPTNPSAAPVAVDVALFTAPEALNYGALSLSAVAANKLYVVNEVAFWGVVLDFAIDDATHDLALQPGDYQGADLVISCDAFDLSAVTLADMYIKVGTGAVANYPAAAAVPVLDDVKNTLTFNLPAAPVAPNPTLWGTDTSVYFFGQGVVEAKGVLKATVAKAAVSPVVIYSTGSTVKYSVAYDAATLTYTVTKGNPAVGTVAFVTDADKEVVNIQVNGRDVEFKKLISGGGSVVASIGDAESGDVFDADLKLYNEVMAFFGFNYDAEGILELRHFASKAALLNVKDEAAVQLYTGSLVIPGGADVPKTGDASSIMGFVMIALAMVAAGFVVSRKVRA